MPGRKARTVWIAKQRSDGSLRIRYPGELAGMSGGFFVVRTAWAGLVWKTPFVTMRPGDPCLEYYREGAPAVYLRLMGRGGDLRGWYVDFTEGVRQASGEWAYRDLVLDAFVRPGGQVLLLDVDEFVQWVQGEAAPAEVRQVVAGLSDLTRRLSGALPPFAKRGSTSLRAGNARRSPP
ncbi:MAG: DUF402 domain-containing protein [Bacillota bacterium]